MALAAAPQVRAQSLSNLVGEVIIAGNSRVDEKVIRDLLQTKPGQYFSEDATKADTEKVMASGEFESVDVERVERDGKAVVTYRVKERPMLTALVIEGNKEISTKKIEAELRSKAGLPLNLATLKDDVERVRKLYVGKGFSRAVVTYEMKDVTAANEASAVITVNEGGSAYVRQVNISGNEHISTFKIKWAMDTKPRNLLLFQRGVFEEYTLKEDMYTVKEMFQKAGYAEAEATYTVKPTPANDGLIVDVTINEGPPYQVGKITIRQAKLRGFEATNLFYEVGLRKGGVFSPQAVEQDADNLRNYYRSFGYADAGVSTKSLLSPESTEQVKVIDVFFEVREKSLFDFGNVYITGNKRTKDVVIRRELNIVPGDRYNYYREETSKQKLQNLDYFDKVEIRDVDSKSVPNAKDVYVNVNEKRTGKLGFGAGFSSVDSFVGFAEISQSNFDWQNWRNWFVGGGQKVRLRAEVGLKRMDYIFSFTEPYFLYETLHGHKVSAGFDIFWRTHNFLAPDYKIMRVGGDVRLGTPISFRWVPYLGKYIGSIRADLTVIGEFIDVEVEDSIDLGDRVLSDDAVATTVIRRRLNPKTGRIRRIVKKVYGWEDYTEKDKYLEDEEGTYFQSSPVLTLTRDTRDSLVLPTRGGLSTLMGKIGAGSALYGIVEAKHEQYLKLFETLPHKPQYPFSGPHVLEVRGSAGYATDDTPLFDRFFLGGPYELRGFGYRMGGPKDYSRDNALGGTSKLFGSIEYTFPIYAFSDKLNIRGALWMDAGNVWWKKRTYYRGLPLRNGSYYIDEETRDNAGEINLSAGMGLRVNLPIGPLRLDYGFPIVKDSESKDWNALDGLTFNVGASF
ncbi:outer membrane protein assembly factor BamA [bacterium]|nr:outer membrane protein assembly factor BamA [bacterium]